jgi:hypothetical protein
MQTAGLEIRVEQARGPHGAAAAQRAAAALTRSPRVRTCVQLAAACARQEERTLAMARLIKCQQSMFEARRGNRAASRRVRRSADA